MSRGPDIGAVRRPMAWAFLSGGIGALVALRRARRIGRGGSAEASLARRLARTILIGGVLFLAGLMLSPTAFGLPLQLAAIGWYVHGWLAVTAPRPRGRS